jgi:hypothetical protein
MEFEDDQASMSLSDNRKVVVEDLIYIDDLQVIIYSTVSPRTSTLWVTSLAKTEAKASKSEQEEKEKKLQKPILLGDLTQKSRTEELKELAELKKIKRKKKKEAEKAEQLVTNHYALLAKLVGHKNADPPSMLYIPESGCLITGEKYQTSYHE